jgi:MFS family permease
MDKKRIATLFLIVLTDTAGATTIVPIIPVYVVALFRATPFQATLLLATFYIAQMLSAPWLGKLSDRFGRRPILLLSQAGTIVSYLLTQALLIKPLVSRLGEGKLLLLGGLLQLVLIRFAMPSISLG